MDSRLHIPFSSQLQAEANASYIDHDDSNACQYQDIIPTVVENHQARYNLNLHAPRSSLLLPNNGLGYAGEEDAAVEWNTRFAPNQHHRTYPLLPMEQYNTRHSDSTLNPCDPNLLRNQWAQDQNAYTQSHIKPLPAYAADPVQEQRKYSEDSENYDPSHKIQIAAPVPLSFSARSKDVLYSMISNSSQSEKAIPLEYSTFTSPPVFRQHPQETEQDTIPSTTTFRDSGIGVASSANIILPTPSPKLLDSHDDFFARYTATNSSTFEVNVSPPANTHHMQIHYQPKHVQAKPIKSISPATLIALTEPFLMDWCTDPDWTVETPTHSDYDVHLKATISQLHHTTYLGNSWGY